MDIRSLIQNNIQKCIIWFPLYNYHVLTGDSYVQLQWKGCVGMYYNCKWWSDILFYMWLLCFRRVEQVAQEEGT